MRTHARPSILYLVQDLTDPAVSRRCAMLRAGGADVVLAGFCRREPLPIEGTAPMNLGRTHDGKMVQRAVAVLRALFTSRGKLAGRRWDAVLARNLEMLAVAHGLSPRLQVPIVYECLDIHRLILRRGPVGAALRWIERRLADRSDLLVTSSPAFLENHFEPAGIGIPCAVVENKVFAAAFSDRPTVSRPESSVIRIGWFGTLRCRRSFDALCEFTRRMEGRFEVVMRGRPATGVLEDLPELVKREPFIEFLGPYDYPDDLAAIYSGVDLVWTVDFYEPGQNSSWLLPNRLYEGGRYGGVPIAIKTNQTGRFLSDHKVGIQLPDLSQNSFDATLGQLDDDQVTRLRKQVEALNPATWTCQVSECESLVTRITKVSTARQRKPLVSHEVA